MRGNEDEPKPGEAFLTHEARWLLVRMLWKIFCWIMAGLLFLLGLWLMVAALFGGILAPIPLVGGVACLVIFTALTVAPAAADWISKPFAALFFPAEEFEKPLLSYALARKYSQERKVDAAVQEYEKILLYYPQERDAYLELIELAQRVGNEKLRAKYEELMNQRDQFKSAEDAV